MDYPTAGADDLIETDDLKYSYSLHAEQNALLNRAPPGCPLIGSYIVATKMPCDDFELIPSAMTAILPKVCFCGG